MKKNFIKFIALALAIVSVGVLGSCKDYDEDHYAEMKVENQTLQDAVNKIKQDLEKQQTEYHDTVKIIMQNYVQESNLDSLINELLKDDGESSNSKAKNSVTMIIEEILVNGDYLTRDDIKDLASKDDLKDFVTKSYLSAAIKDFITKDDIKDFANKSEIERLEKLINDVKCVCDYTAKFNQIQSTLDSYGDSIAEHHAEIVQNANEIAKLYTIYNALVATDAAINGRVDSLGNVTTNIQNNVNSINDHVNNLCDSLKISYAQAVENKLAIEKVNSDLQIMQLCIDSVADATTKAIEDSIAAVRAEADANLQAAMAYTDAVALNLSNLIDALTTRLDGVDNRLDGVDNRLDGVDTRIDGIDVTIDGLNTRIGDLDQLVNGILLDIMALQDKDTELEGSITELKSTIAELKEQIKNDINTLKEKDVELEQYIKDLQAKDIQHDSFIQTLQAEDLLIWAAIEALQEQDKTFADNIKALQDKDAELQDAIDANTADIADLKNDVVALATKIEAIQNYLKSQITGIQVQATKNPVFGSINTPFGINTNMLMAYYGNLEITPSKLKGTPFAGTQSEAVTSPNAGKLYLTINPITNDFTGVQLELVNSKGQAAGIELSCVTPSDEELKFGYTRAAVEANSETGLYEATATIANLNKAKLNLNRDALANAARDLYNNKLDANFVNISKVILDQVNGILPAYAVQASWKDEAGKTHKVVSKYEIAATAIKPLGYNSLQEFSKNDVPGLNRVRDFIDEWTGKMKNKINFNIKNKITLPGKIKNISISSNGKYTMHINQEVELNINNITIDKSKLSFVSTGANKFYLTDGNKYAALNGESIEWLATSNQPGKSYIYVDLDDFEISADQDIQFDIVGQKLTLDFDVDVTNHVKDIYKDINVELSGFNGSINDLNTLIDQAQNLMDDINGKQDDIKNTIDDVRDRLYSYLDKINNRLGKFFDFHHMLQPCMVIETGNKVSHIVGTENAPQALAMGNATIYLTSYNMDILAPAYKKCLVVEGPNGKQQSEILNSNETYTKFDFSVAGKYKLTYYAMDFYGNVEKVENYVNVK